MTRSNPENGNNNPQLIRAFWSAIEHNLISIEEVAERQAKHGRRWNIPVRRTLTTSQDKFYIFIDNPDNNKRLDFEGGEIFTDGLIDLTIYDEPSVDTGTFNSGEFRNVRSSVTKNPPYDFYTGTDNNVTISNKGRVFIETTIESGKKTNIGKDDTSPEYIIDSSSSALIEINNTAGKDIDIAMNFRCHEEVGVRDLTKSNT